VEQLSITKSPYRSAGTPERAQDSTDSSSRGPPFHAGMITANSFMTL
jgi:hypothetical protein